MGVWGCYPARKKNRTQIDCINLAMESWIRRKATHKTDNKALRAYNNTRHRVKYADTVSKIADKIRKVHAR